MAPHAFDGWAVMERGFEHAGGVSLVRDRIFRATPHALDDFAGARTDDAVHRAMPGLGR